MVKNKILLLETVADDANEILLNQENYSLLKNYESIASETQMADVEAIITRGIGQVTSALMDACPKLKVIARCGVGLDNIQVAEASKRNIAVINAPGSNANTVAEHTIALILNLTRNLYEAFNEVKNGNWASRSTFQTDEVNGKTIGILGLGNIGLKVAKIAEAFGMKVIYYSQNKKDVDYEYVTIEELFRRSNIVSVHIAFTATNLGLINKNLLCLMPKKSILVNTARHQLINQKDVIDALNSRQLAGYAADVPMSPPPTADDQLISHPRALITAHVSSLTATTYNKMCVQTVNTVINFLQEKPFDLNSIFNRKELK